MEAKSHNRVTNPAIIVRQDLMQPGGSIDEKRLAAVQTFMEPQSGCPFDAHEVV